MENHRNVNKPLHFTYLQEVADELSTGVMFVDNQLRVSYANIFAANLSGDTPDKLTGNSIREIAASRFGPAIGRIITRHIINVLRTGISYAGTRWESPVKPGFFTEQNLHRLNGNDGEPLGVIITFTDVSSYVHVEQALRQSEEQFRIVADFTLDWEYWEDPYGQFIYISPSVEMITGYPPEVFVENPEIYIDIIYPEDRVRFKHHAGVVLAECTDHPIDFRITRRDGTERWISHICQKVFSSDGIYLGIRGSNRDITERKKIEEAFQVSEQRFFSAFEFASIGMALVSPEGRWLRVNKAFCDLVGYSKDELLSLTFQDITHPDDLKADLGYVHQMLSGEIITYQMEKRYIHKSGRIVWGLLSVSMARDNHDHPLYFISQIQDITQRKVAEEELKKAVEMEAKARSVAQHQSELMQKALLPSLPPAPEGYKVSVKYVPGTPELDIGGDFYDLLTMMNGQIAILIGDVSGKGVEAVSLASSTRAIVRAFAYSITSSGYALTHANKVICAQETERTGYSSKFVTVELLEIDLATGIMHYSSAGHPPPMICRANGRVDILSFGQPPIGIESKIKYLESESRLNTGDKIIFYTDGIHEARHGIEFFGLKGIEATIKRYKDSEPDVLVENLINSAKSWSGGILRDDAVIIVLERLG